MQREIVTEFREAREQGTPAQIALAERWRNRLYAEGATLCKRAAARKLDSKDMSFLKAHWTALSGYIDHEDITFTAEKACHCHLDKVVLERTWFGGVTWYKTHMLALHVHLSDMTRSATGCNLHAGIAGPQGCARNEAIQHSCKQPDA